MTPEEFWAHVDMPLDLTDEELLLACWPWTGGTNKDGYAIVRIDGRVTYGFWFAHDSVFGPPPAGLLRRHQCHWKRCCNPWHIHVGTHRQNMADSGILKLDAARVGEIRRRRAAGETSPTLAAEFGVSAGYVRAICSPRSRTWRHVEGGEA